MGECVHYWPFDGFEIPAGRSAIAAVYPALCSRSFLREGRNAHQHHTYGVARWLSHADADGSLRGFLETGLTTGERETAHVEGWILGVA